MTNNKIINLNNDNFNEEVLESDIPVLVDFGQHGVVHVE